ncbi:MAG: bifunctional DNA-formamidopyrimidine glycosylase/DNA-(apurinic or apyrimidinic site) lyase [Minisyncoccales bacterium]
MPELPEVETTVNELKEKITSRTIRGLFIESPSLIKRPRPEIFKKEVLGKKIKKIWRKGKNILFELSREKILLIHQKLSGHLLVGKWKKERGKWISLAENPSLKENINLFLRVIFLLDNKEMLALSDLRKFAKLELWDKKELLQSETFKKIGPDALKISFEEFEKRLLEKRKRPIKEVLMNQEVIAGIGNIYSDEILWRAKIHPLKKIEKLSKKELKEIFLKMKKVLKKAILLKGESISDYRRPSGEKGYFDQERKVYRREKEKCYSCSNLIKRIKLGSRSSYFCPSCQKL